MAHIAIRSRMNATIVTLSPRQSSPQRIADVLADFRTSQEYQASYLSNQAVNELCHTLMHNMFHALTDWREIPWIPTPITMQATNLSMESTGSPGSCGASTRHPPIRRSRGNQQK
jgi:hypothetical protein